MSSDLLMKINLPKPRADAATARSDFAMFDSQGNSSTRNDFPREFERQIRENEAVRNVAKDVADQRDRVANERAAADRADQNRRALDQRSDSQRMESQRVENQRAAAGRAEQQQSDAKVAADRAAQDRQRAEQAERVDPRNGKELPENRSQEGASDTATRQDTVAGDAAAASSEDVKTRTGAEKPNQVEANKAKSGDSESASAASDATESNHSEGGEEAAAVDKDGLALDALQATNQENPLATEVTASENSASVDDYLNSALTDPASVNPQGAAGNGDAVLDTSASEGLDAAITDLDASSDEEATSGDNSLDRWLKEQLMEAGGETTSVDASNGVDPQQEGESVANTQLAVETESVTSSTETSEAELASAKQDALTKGESETNPLKNDSASAKQATGLESRSENVDLRAGVQNQQEGQPASDQNLKSDQLKQAEGVTLQTKADAGSNATFSQSGTAAQNAASAPLPFQMKAGAEEMAQAVQAASKDNAELGSEPKPNTSMLPVNKGDLANELAMLKKLKMPGTQLESSVAKKAEGETDSGFKTSSFGRALEQFGAIKPAAAKPLSVPIQSPLNNARFAPELSDRMLMMVSKRVQVAEIRIDPPDLGPVDVKVRYNKEQAHVTFTSHVATVRDAIEQSVPKLREMFEESGLGLGDVDVQDKSQRDQQTEREAAGGGHGSGTHTGEQDETAEDQRVRSVAIARGLVDYYA